MTDAASRQAPRFHRIGGALVLPGSLPDGDSIRFHPDHPRALARLAADGPLALATDGGVQLRLEGIDAPELHYRGAEQPYGRTARDELLDAVGFRLVHFKDDRVTVRETAPAIVPAVILAQACDPHGRPIAHLFTGDAAPARADDLDDAHLRYAINAQLLRSGAVFPLLYDTMPSAHRALFRSLAQQALRAGHGVWAHHRTAHGLPLHDGARTTHAPLVFPKLFRRVVDYLGACDHGFDGSILEWLDDPVTGASGNDRLELRDGTRARLRDVLELREDHVGLAIDPIEVTFFARRPTPRPRIAAPVEYPLHA
jgi:endonuclease YncB( thermonuclease family)